MQENKQKFIIHNKPDGNINRAENRIKDADNEMKNKILAQKTCH